MKTAIQLVERGFVPKPLVRRGIRRLLRQRLLEQTKLWSQDPARVMESWAEEMRSASIALVPDKANEQHYEVPPDFFRLVLGKHRKYSSAFYRSDSMSLDDAEATMLELTCERAGLEDGQDILELGCGWGSLSLWMAQNYQKSRITAVSNSAPQRRSILARAEARGLSNLKVVTADMNEFDIDQRFDRIVSVEMFEHMRNWEALLKKAARWLSPDGQMFMHVFAHKKFAYPFEVRNEADWMSQFFFSGGMMPSHEMLDSLDVPFQVAERWEVSGMHYAQTAEDWAKNLVRNKKHVMPILAQTYGSGNARTWFYRWEMFFLACAELFGWDGGNEWIVSHQLLRHSTRGELS